MTHLSTSRSGELGAPKLVAAALFAGLLFSALASAQAAENDDAQASAEAEVEAEPADESAQNITLVEAYRQAPRMYISPEDGLFISASIGAHISDNLQVFDGSEEYPSADIELGLELGESLLPGLRASALYSGGGLARTKAFYDAFSFGWERHMIMLVADWGPEFYGFFRPALRVGAGYSLQRLELHDGRASQHSYGHGLAGLATLRLEFSTPRRWFSSGLRFSLMIDSGATGQTSAEFNKLSDREDIDEKWAQQSASLGKFPLPAKYVSVGFGLSSAF